MVTPGVNGEPPRRVRWGSTTLLVVWAAIGAGALLLLAKSVQNSSEFGRLQPWILLLNVIGVIALSALLARKLWQLVRDYRNHVPGSRLTVRAVRREPPCRGALDYRALRKACGNCRARAQDAGVYDGASYGRSARRPWPRSRGRKRRSGSRHVADVPTQLAPFG